MKKKFSLLLIIILFACSFALLACDSLVPWNPGGDPNPETPSYSVSFNSLGGSAVAQVKNIQSGSKIQAPVSPTQAGYIFDAWYKESAVQNAWDFDMDTVTEDITLYAKWTERIYTVSYRDAGDVAFSGTQPNDYPIAHTYGTDTILSVPSKTDWVFLGWFIGSDGAGSAIVSLSATGYTADITLYAKWIYGTYTISYRDIGDTELSGEFLGNYPVIHTYGIATNLADPIGPYEFSGWFLNSDGSGLKVTSLPAECAENITLWDEMCEIRYNWLFGGWIFFSKSCLNGLSYQSIIKRKDMLQIAYS